ncbi:glycosyl hydrolase [Brevibacillus composti]|uniref:Glycosyl hydrolase n=1 Tax=Brevibacillus composti TaxID=2796470 RepID=A0A7T5EN04_9BACL|nr:stalk domain-containing protein [Brevibacillus composti]QQE75522.1 glycosyl hydrolase [Brevibacillus composti]QUO42548.1 glycosyl hydrolase [Brevibacillus composti]
MNLRKLTLSLAICLVSLSGGQQSAAAATTQTTILLDGYPLPFPTPPTTINGTTMVPFRAISEAMGIRVQWEAQTQSITAIQSTDQGEKTVLMQLNNPLVTVDGQTVTLPVAPYETNGSTLIPLRFFSEQFGAQVDWNQDTRTVSIASPVRDMYGMAFYAISSFSQRELMPAFDSVAFGWSRIDQGGNLTLTGKDFYWPKPAGEVTPESIISDVKLNGSAPYLMVFAGDANGELTLLLENEGLQEKAIAQMLSIVQEKGLTGIALDFEGLGLNGDVTGVKEKFNQFVQQLAGETKQRGIPLTLILHPLNGAYKGYDYATLGNLADDIVIMAYAYEDEKNPEPMNRVDEAIRLALAHVPKEKLILGISMGSENEQSVTQKLGLAKRYNLKGYALWRLGLIKQAAMQKINESVK